MSVSSLRVFPKPTTCRRGTGCAPVAYAGQARNPSRRMRRGTLTLQLLPMSTVLAEPFSQSRITARVRKGDHKNIGRVCSSIFKATSEKSLMP